MNYASSIFTAGGSHLERPRALVVAPKVMAASMLNGNTFHLPFRLNFGDELVNRADSSLDKLENSLDEVGLLIEMSMVRSDCCTNFMKRCNRSNKMIAYLEE